MKLRAQNRVVTGALVLLIILVVAGALLSAQPARADELFRIEGRAPLGLATDHARDRFWVLDRASGRLTLTALADDGSVQGQMSSRDSLTNAQALAFDAGEAYIGDVGGRRAQVTIYQVTEPWPGTEILRAIPYALSYPDGRHDAAAILVDAAHRLHVVTSGPEAGVYQAPASLSTTEPNGLTRVASVPDGVTDSQVLHDGRVVLRTASSLVTLDPATWAELGQTPLEAEAGAALTEALTPNEVVVAAGPSGEAQTFEVPGPAPTVRATARPARAPATQTQSQSADPEATRTFEQTGTTVAFVAALVLAALSAAVVLVRR